jgi:intein/homing endonuclease
VLTRSGEVPIEQVVPGDEVLSFNHLHKRTEYKLVKDTARHSTRKRLLKINSLDGSVIVTEDHPVWSEDRQEYVEARLLRVGERLVLHRHYVPPAE